MKTKATSFRIPEEQYKLAKEIAKANKVSIADLLRGCVANELKAMYLYGCGSYEGVVNVPEPLVDSKRGRHIILKEPIPEALRWAVFERDEFGCKRCGSRRFLCADHIIPEAKGGATTMENLQTLCRSCNSKKGKK